MRARGAPAGRMHATELAELRRQAKARAAPAKPLSPEELIQRALMEIRGLATPHGRVAIATELIEKELAIIVAERDSLRRRPKKAED